MHLHALPPSFPVQQHDQIWLGSKIIIVYSLAIYYDGKNTGPNI